MRLSPAAFALLLPLAAQAAEGEMRRVQHELSAIPQTPGGPARFRLPDRVAHTDTARLSVRVDGTQSEVPREQWGFVDRRTIQLLPIGSQPGPQHAYELSYDAIPGP